MLRGILLFFKIYFSLRVCVYACVWVSAAGACWGQKRMSDSWSWSCGSCDQQTWMLGNELEASATAACSVKCWASSPAQRVLPVLTPTYQSPPLLGVGACIWMLTNKQRKERRSDSEWLLKFSKGAKRRLEVWLTACFCRLQWCGSVGVRGLFSGEASCNAKAWGVLEKSLLHDVHVSNIFTKVQELRSGVAACHLMRQAVFLPHQCLGHRAATH